MDKWKRRTARVAMLAAPTGLARAGYWWLENWILSLLSFVVGPTVSSYVVAIMSVVGPVTLGVVAYCWGLRTLGTKEAPAKEPPRLALKLEKSIADAHDMVWLSAAVSNPPDGLPMSVRSDWSATVHFADKEVVKSAAVGAEERNGTLSLIQPGQTVRVRLTVAFRGIAVPRRGDIQAARWVVTVSDQLGRPLRDVREP